MHNDHFVQIAGGRQVLVGGELPYRDFADPGLPLQYYLSALTMALSGENLLAEALVCIVLISIGVAVTYELCRRATGSPWIASLATVIVLLLSPRLYSYQKAFILPLGLLLIWRYVDHPSRGRLFALASGTAVAFLLRHDHAVYVGCAAAAAIVLAHGGSAVPLVRRLTMYGVLFLAVLTPFWLFIALNGGIAGYFAEGLEFSRSESYNNLFAYQPPFVIRQGAPPMAAITDPRNGVTWLFWCFVLWPTGALILVGWEYLRQLLPRASLDRPKLLPKERASIGSAAVLTLVALPPLLRPQQLEARLGDVAPLCVVLGAWLLALLWRRSGSPNPAVRLGSGALGAALAGLTIVSSVGAATSPEQLRRMFTDPRAAVNTASSHIQRLSTWRGRGEFADYVRACTRPEDRLLFTWFAPDSYVSVGRLFAGGQMYIHNAIGSSTRAQTRIVERMARQSVPLIVMYRKGYGDFNGDYQLVAAHIRANYDHAAEWRPNPDADPFDIWVHRQARRTGVHATVGLPCFV